MMRGEGLGRDVHVQRQLGRMVRALPVHALQVGRTMEVQHEVGREGFDELLPAPLRGVGREAPRELSIEINAVSADLIATDFIAWTSITRGLTRSPEFHHAYYYHFAIASGKLS